MVFDEFQDILNLEDSYEALALLRSKIQFQSAIPYIFVGSIRHKMDAIFTHHDSPFFKSAIPMTVDPLPYKGFSQFLRKKFTKGQRKIDDETLKKVFEMANNISGDIQQLWDLWIFQKLCKPFLWWLSLPKIVTKFQGWIPFSSPGCAHVPCFLAESAPQRSPICPNSASGHTCPFCYQVVTSLDPLNMLNAICLHITSHVLFSIFVNLALYAPSWRWLSPKYCSTIYLFFDIFLFLFISTSVNFTVVVSFRIILSEREALRAGGHPLSRSDAKRIDWVARGTLYLRRLFLSDL